MLALVFLRYASKVKRREKAVARDLADLRRLAQELVASPRSQRLEGLFLGAVEKYHRLRGGDVAGAGGILELLIKSWGVHSEVSIRTEILMRFLQHYADTFSRRHIHQIAKTLGELIAEFARKEESDPQIMVLIGRLRTASNEDGRYYYQTALWCVEESSGKTAAKKLALDIGRWHFGRIRKGGRASIYDEQAINNDLSARVQYEATR